MSRNYHSAFGPKMSDFASDDDNSIFQSNKVQPKVLETEDDNLSMGLLTSRDISLQPPDHFESLNKAISKTCCQSIKPCKKHQAGQLFRKMVDKLVKVQADENVKMLLVGEQDLKANFMKHLKRQAPQSESIEIAHAKILTFEQELQKTRFRLAVWNAPDRENVM